MIILYVEFLMVVLSSWLLTREFFGIQGLSESVIICFMLGFAQVVLEELLCGIAGKLYYSHVFAAFCAVKICSARFARALPGTGTSPRCFSTR